MKARCVWMAVMAVAMVSLVIGLNEKAPASKRADVRHGAAKGHGAAKVTHPLHAPTSALPKFSALRDDSHDVKRHVASQQHASPHRPVAHKRTNAETHKRAAVHHPTKIAKAKHPAQAHTKHAPYKKAKLHDLEVAGSKELGELERMRETLEKGRLDMERVKTKVADAEVGVDEVLSEIAEMQRTRQLESNAKETKESEDVSDNANVATVDDDNVLEEDDAQDSVLDDKDDGVNNALDDALDDAAGKDDDATLGAEAKTTEAEVDDVDQPSAEGADEVAEVDTAQDAEERVDNNVDDTPATAHDEDDGNAYSETKVVEEGNDDVAEAEADDDIDDGDDQDFEREQDFERNDVVVSLLQDDMNDNGADDDEMPLMAPRARPMGMVQQGDGKLTKPVVSRADPENTRQVPSGPTVDPPQNNDKAHTFVHDAESGATADIAPDGTIIPQVAVTGDDLEGPPTSDGKVLSPEDGMVGVEDTNAKSPSFPGSSTIPTFDTETNNETNVVCMCKRQGAPKKMVGYDRVVCKRHRPAPLPPPEPITGIRQCIKGTWPGMTGDGPDANTTDEICIYFPAVIPAAPPRQDLDDREYPDECYDHRNEFVAPGVEKRPWDGPTLLQVGYDIKHYEECGCHAH